MKKSTIFILGLTISNSLFASQGPTLHHAEKCNNEYKVTKENSDGDYKSPQSLLSSKYCLDDRRSIYQMDNIDVTLLPDSDKLRQLFGRYREVYSELSSEEMKIQFVDLFLHRASNKYHITSNPTDQTWVKTVVFSRLGHSGKQVGGDALNLFYNDVDRENLSRVYSAYIENSTTIASTPELLNMVDYILEGSEKKLESESKQVRVAEPSFVKFLLGRNTAQGRTTALAQKKWYGPNLAYERWAQRQALGWCNTCDYWWETAGRLKYLIIYNDYGDMWSAYHYYMR